MQHCDLTLPSPEENLACDEALLERCERLGTEVLRFWEPEPYFVVVGYANRIATEVNLPFCQQSDIPVLRRSTGGGAVLQGPGCLNYSLVLHIDAWGPLKSINATNGFVLDRHREALTALLPEPADREGQTDLAIRGRKFSGNAQRRRKDYLLFHGSFLLDFNLELVGKALPFPSRQPEYRRGRSHAEFLTNLNLPAARLKQALTEAWGANAPLPVSPSEQIARLVHEKYARPEWTLKF